MTPKISAARTLEGTYLHNWLGDQTQQVYLQVETCEGVAPVPFVWIDMADPRRWAVQLQKFNT